MKHFILALSFFMFLAMPLLAEEKVSLTTEDRWKIAALYQQTTNGVSVILLHDLGGKKEDFKNFSNALAENGYGYLAIDLRGHGASTNLNLQKNFKKTGTNNEFNQMVRDVNAAIAFLNNKGVKNENIFLLGAGLGANVAAKSLIFNTNIAGVLLLTPSLKTRDVLTMSGIKIFKKPVFIAVSSEDRKSFMEASFIRNAAYLSSGSGKVAFITAYNLRGVPMLDKYLTPDVLQWLKTPQLPEVKPDAVDLTPPSTELAEPAPQDLLDTSLIPQLN
ncbi:MAG: alpha/beta hydrolase [Elusimicrobiota bacterium]|jgi:dienelactone hydrolase|nr:alpha/beta hydrolase [Elusimicrobiota bacterium]